MKTKVDQSVFTISILIALIVVSSLVLSACSSDSASESSKTQLATAPVSTSSASITTPISSYKDGSYSAVGTYQAPSGTEKIGVNLTIKAGIVTASTVDQLGVHPNSKKFQAIFAENYKTFVVGKDVSSLNLDVVSGSSLSPKGFNNAISQIKTQAQA